MTAGRKPKPTKIKILEGAKKSRINLKEPTFKVLPKEPPPFLDDVAKAEWLRVWPEVKMFITTVDKTTLAAYCVAFSRWLQADKQIQDKSKLTIQTPNGSFQQSPFVAMARNWQAAMVKYAAELGFTPASRSKVKTGSEDDPDEKFLFGNK